MKSDFASVVRSFSDLQVMIIGDVMIDSYLWGNVDRISPEAPVPIIISTSEENRLGGAANVAVNIQALGAVPILCSVVGNDMRAKTFKELLQAQNITAKGIMEDNDRITTVKTRIISNHQHLLRVDRETDKPLSPIVEDRFKKHLTTILNSTDIHAVIFEDYDKGAITPGIIDHITQEARQRKIPTLVDPKKRNFLHYHSLTLFKPNFKEFTEGLKVECIKTQPDSLFEAAKILHENKKIGIVMITLSEAGVFISDGNQYKIIPAHIRDIADVSGAGDTVISVASLCMASGLDAYTTAAIANTAGGLVCEKIGVVPIEKERLVAEVTRLQLLVN